MPILYICDAEIGQLDSVRITKFPTFRYACLNECTIIENSILPSKGHRTEFSVGLNIAAQPTSKNHPHRCLFQFLERCQHATIRAQCLVNVPNKLRNQCLIFGGE